MGELIRKAILDSDRDHTLFPGTGAEAAQPGGNAESKAAGVKPETKEQEQEALADEGSKKANQPAPAPAPRRQRIPKANPTKPDKLG